MLVTSEGCKPCTRVKRFLKELQVDMPGLSLEEIDFASPAGSKLAVENAILYPPAVFIDGKLIGKGKIDAEKLVATIREMDGAH
ncbi:MAG: glutaredoxin domain-containing protein [Nitrososphaera sp.]